MLASRVSLALALALPSLAALASAPAAAAEATRGLSPEDVARTRAVTQAEISPDGTRVAYVLSVPRRPFQDKDGPNWAELHVVGVDGSDRTYVGGEVNVAGIAWVEDGARIAFLAKRQGDEHKALYAIPLEGGEAVRVVRHAADVTAFDWQGDTIAFLAAPKEDEAAKKRKEHGFDAQVYEERERFAELYVVKPSSGEAPRRIEVSGQPSEAKLSPDATRLALALAPSPRIDDHYMNRHVAILDVETGSTKVSFPNRGKLGDLTWSPDGSSLAIVSGEDRHDPSEGRLYLASAEGGEWKDLLPNHQGHVGAVAWNNPNRMTVLVDEGCSTKVYTVRPDGSVQQAPTGGTDLVLSHLSLAENGQAGAAVCHTAAHPPEVYFAGRGMREPRRLTDSNPWLADVRLAKQEVVEFQARDGLALQGILIRPLDEEEGKKYPLILTVHGGPEAHDSNGWVTRYAAPGQVGAAKGYAIFHPNYRGSTGRGVEFSKLGQGDYAGKEFDDLVDAVDHLVNTGLVDKDKVGVTGGSYGGYASAWCATKLTDRFAAAVMFVGISNNVSKNGTTDIPQEMELVHARMNVAENIDFLMERSPVSWVKQAKTPILIMHGKDDPRVHPAQSMELYRQLKNVGQVPVRLVYFPGEGHGNQRAASKYEYCLRMLQWFDHYLKGAGGAPPAVDLEYPLQKKDV